MIGRIAQSDELDEYLADASGPLSFTMLLNMFGERMSGEEGTDDDDAVIAAFNAFDEGDGTVGEEEFRHALMTWGDKYTMKDCDTIFAELPISNSGRIDLKGVVTMLTSAPAEDEEETSTTPQYNQLNNNNGRKIFHWIYDETSAIMST